MFNKKIYFKSLALLLGQTSYASQNIDIFRYKLVSHVEYWKGRNGI